MAVVGADRGTKRSRGASYMHTGIALLCMIILATVLLTAPQSPPPAIAEIAPQAVEQITEAPPEQASGTGGQGPGGGDGGGAGGGGPGQPAPPAPPGEGPEVPRKFRCIGDPPRQIEDPQSPPCVPFWEGDNGGATYPKGVSATEVRVGVWHPYFEVAEIYAEFFNRNFEFYGRKMKVVRVTMTAGGGVAGEQASPAAEKRDAQRADTEQNIFASAYYPVGGRHYAEELARRGIVYAGWYPVFTEDYMAAHRPYIWQYGMAVDLQFRNMGDWICSRLKGKPALHAEGDQQGDPRRFAVVVTRQPGNNLVTLGPIQQVMNQCQADAQFMDAGDFGVFAADPPTATTTVLNWKDDGVTTVVCLCSNYDYAQLGYTATQQGYFPEWVNGSYFLGDKMSAIKASRNPEQMSRTLGISFVPRVVHPDEEPSQWARSEVYPGADRTYTSRHSGIRDTFNQFYESMLLIASGIQMAGPNLTPETFERALQTTVFPNPDHPINAGKVGFQGGRHSMTMDGAEWWFDPFARGPYEDPDGGAICYIDGGARHSIGNWPGPGDPFRQPPCDSGAAPRM